MVAPLLEELAEEYSDKMDFTKLNVDQSPKTAAAYKVMSIPTLIIFKDGKPVSNIVGFKPKAQLKQELDSVIG